MRRSARWSGGGIRAIAKARALNLAAKDALRHGQMDRRPKLPWDEGTRHDADNGIYGGRTDVGVCRGGRTDSGAGGKGPRPQGGVDFSGDFRYAFAILDQRRRRHAGF